jgi:hypothetical protein
MLMKQLNLWKTAFLAPTAFLFFMLVSHNAAAALVIDFQTGPAGAGGTITESGGEVIGSNINISLMILDGIGGLDGSYATEALLSFDTSLNTIQIVGTIDPFVAVSQQLLSGSFDNFSYSVQGGNGVFIASGPDTKACALLCEIGVDPDISFEYFAFSIESVNGSVISTDIVNTAADFVSPPVPIPAAAWLFGSALLGLGAVKRRKA